MFFGGRANAFPPGLAGVLDFAVSHSDPVSMAHVVFGLDGRSGYVKYWAVVDCGKIILQFISSKHPPSCRLAQ